MMNPSERMLRVLSSRARVKLASSTSRAPFEMKYIFGTVGELDAITIKENCAVQNTFAGWCQPNLQCAVKTVAAIVLFDVTSGIVEVCQQDVVAHVVDKFIFELESQLEQKKVTINVDAAARNWLHCAGWSVNLRSCP